MEIMSVLSVCNNIYTRSSRLSFKSSPSLLDPIAHSFVFYIFEKTDITDISLARG